MVNTPTDSQLSPRANENRARTRSRCPKEHFSSDLQEDLEYLQLNPCCEFRWATHYPARYLSYHVTEGGNGNCPSSVSQVYQFIMIEVSQSVKIFLNSAGYAVPLSCLLRSVLPFKTAPLGGSNLF